MRNSNKEDWSKLLPDDPQGADALWDMSAGFGESTNVDVSKAWAQFEQHLETKQEVPQAKVRRFAWKRSLTAAAAAVALLFVINFFASSDSVIEYANIENAEKALTLEDNTEVTLEKGASITVRMEDDARFVELLGEASFDVAPNAKRPFTVTTPELDLVVIGTEFTVRSGASASVAVREGHVRVRGRNEVDWTDLRAGDQASIRSALVVVDEDPIILAWNSLRFESEELSKVVDSIEKAHDINLVIPNKLANCSLTADFSQNSVSEIASSLAVLFSAELSINGQNVELKGGHCQ
ncbi:MAG: FecR family protein [Saprospiraceae bacterium]